MKTCFKLFTVFSIFLLISCEKSELRTPEEFPCSFSFPDSSRSHSQDAQLENILNTFVEKGIPGLSLYLRTPDQKTWTGAAGMADIGNQIPLKACNPMLIASISKVFTAVTIFQLQDEGKLDIDDPLKNYLDQSLIGKLENANEVSLKQMLNHTSGLYDYLGGLEFDLETFNNPEYRLTEEEKIQLAWNKKASHKPGERYEYSNTNFVLLGLVVKKITGKYIGEAVKDRIYSPLGLLSADFGTPQDPIPEGLPLGYFSLTGVKGNNDLIEASHIYGADLATGDGGVSINMQDLGHFFEALFHGELLSEEAFQQMTQTLFEKPEGEALFDWATERTALGIDRLDTPFGPAYCHTGGIYGFLSMAMIFPESNVVIAYSINGVSPLINSMFLDIAEEVIDLSF